MKQRTLWSWAIGLVMLVATLASIAYADSIAVDSFWTTNNGNLVSVNQGENPELLVLATSNNDFLLYVQVLQGNTLVDDVVFALFVPANLDNAPYLQTIPIPTTGLAGDYTVRVHAFNVDGQDTAQLDLHVETSPTVNSVADQDVNEGQTLQFTASGSDQDGDSVTLVTRKVCAAGNWLCNLAEALVPNTQNHVYSGMTFNQQTGQFSYSPDFATVKHPATEREFPLKIRAYDNSNQWSAWEYVKVTVNDVNQLPQFTSMPVTAGAENAYYVYPLTAVDADAEDDLAFSLASGPAGMLVTPNNVLRWTPTFEQAGEQAVTLQISDGLTAVPQSFTISVQNTNRAPELAPIGNKQVDEGSTLSFTVTATDADGDQFSLSTTNLPAGATFNQQSGQFSWTPTLEQAGNYQVTFRAMDIFGDVGLETITITVGNVNQAPVVTPVDEQSVDEGDLLQFTVSATDADGDALTFATSGWPTGATLVNNWDSTATFSWTPDFTQAGTYTLTFQVTDSTALVSETFAVTVRDVTQPTANTPPVIASLNDQTVNEGELLSFTVTATDADNDQLTLNVQNLPAGANFDGVAGEFTWTPGFAQAGIYAVTFTASDGQPGGIDAEAVLITVTDVSQPQPVPGCTDPAATNFNPNATQNDGSCTYPPQPVLGCTDSAATNFNPNANTDDGSCTYPPQPVLGCTDQNATNYNPNATQNDGSCVYPPVNQAPVINVLTIPSQLTVAQAGQFTVAATDADGDALTFAWTFGDGQNSAVQNPTHAYSNTGQYTVTVTVSDGQATATDSRMVTVIPAVVFGCTDQTALNFNPQATFNDGSCQFSGKNVAIATVQIPEIASAGDYLAVNVIAKNSGNEQLKNLQITVLAYDLNTFGSSNTFTLNPGKSTSKLVYVPLPYDAWPGSYLVKITVDNGVARDSTYRQVWVQ